MRQENRQDFQNMSTFARFKINRYVLSGDSRLESETKKGQKEFDLYKQNLAKEESCRQN